MFRLLAWLGTFIVLLVAAAIFLVSRALEDQPLVSRGEEVSTAAISRARDILRRNDPRRLAPNTTREVRLAGPDLEALLNFAARRGIPGAASLDLRQGGADVRYTANLPRLLADLGVGRFVNVDASLCASGGSQIDIEQVRLGIGSDQRIGTHFLYAGCGYGGSCFPKDVKALIKTANGEDQELLVLKAVEAANERQKTVLVSKVTKRFGADLSGKHFALWGLAFKPNTDDMREATSRVVLAELFERGATVTAYDPVAMEEARRIFGDDARLSYADSPNAALQGADALIIVTEWKEFRSPDFDKIKASLKTPVIFDGRNLYEPALVKQAGLSYESIGRATVQA